MTDSARPPTRDERDQAATAVRAMQDALAPQVDALYDTPSGQDLLEAFDHYGRAADHLHHVTPGGIGIALAELTAAAELLRTAAGRDTATAIAVTPLASLTDEALGQIGQWPVTHASIEAVGNPRIVLTPTDSGEYILTDGGQEVARFAAESDALAAAVTDYMPEVNEADVAGGKTFNVFLTPEGYESSDGRLWELGTVTWRDPPLALMFQDTASHGPGDPDAAWFAGAIDKVWRDPADASRIMGQGRLVPGADGDRAQAMIRAGLRGVSIDGHGGKGLPPVKQVTQVSAEGEPLSALVRYSDLRIMGASVVPHPAFEPCCIWFDDEATPERVTATHGMQIPMDAQPTVLDDGMASLVAAGGGPQKPPKAWFTAQPPQQYEPVTREGAWIHGHLGKAGTCHIGIAGKCETIPASSTGYKYFHRTTAECAEGDKVACGWLTMNTGHEGLRADPKTTMAHYDNTGTQVAKVRIVDTPHGPWMTGAVAPGLDEQTLWKLEAPEVSGDWRDIDGFHRELVAVLGVPLPGFLTQRPEALVASGRIVAQTGALPCDDCGPSPLAADFWKYHDPSLAALERAGILGDAPSEAEIGRRLAIIRMERQLAALRPQVMGAIHEKVSPAPMVEAAKKAAEPDPADEWRAKLRV